MCHMIESAGVCC